MTRRIKFSSLTIPVVFSATVFGQVTKDGADERLDKAIGLFRMTVATETKLFRWFEVDQDNPDAVALKTDLCGNWPNVKKTIDDVSELAIQLKKDKSLAADAYLSKKMAELLPFKQQVISKKRQLDAMGLTCPAIQEKSVSATTEPEASGSKENREEKMLISVSPDFRVAAMRELGALGDLKYALGSFLTSEQKLDELKDNETRASRDVSAFMAPKSSDRYYAENFVALCMGANSNELLKLGMARLSRRREALGLGPLPGLESANMEQVAICESEVRDALEASLSAEEWTRRIRASKCSLASRGVTASPEP